ncbi:putative ABC transporter B family member 8 [Dichanthelium oligosanthes]|uniref:Putative ABC transporter B family member 8 n=1 Tax=Dichanthelium oligosanthes TaxID=888268 RepID=A0A1E5UPX9_9POAL|nr:putative ABC transporter B family member 8 [Dichanthelium oligosanthes]
MSIRGMFRFAEKKNVLLMALGTLGAIEKKNSTNLLLIFASDVKKKNGYGPRGAQGGGAEKKNVDFMHEVEKKKKNFVYLAFAVLAVAKKKGYCWSRTRKKKVLRIRYLYLQAILKKKVGFFDSQEATTSEIINSISKDASLIQEVLKKKKKKILMHSTVFVSGLAKKKNFCWRLALVSFPLKKKIIIPGLIYGKYILKKKSQSRHEYAEANSLKKKTLGSIKTVYSFTAKKKIIQKYTAILDKTIKKKIKQGIAKGLAVGFTGLSFAIWAFLAWYGGKKKMHHQATGGRIYAAKKKIVLGGLSLGMALKKKKHFTEASVAATRIKKKINRVPQINADDPKKKKLDQIRGEIQFESVKKKYPSRPNMPVLKDLKKKIPSGQTIALVGSRKKKKSTAIALVQRFYEKKKGTVKIDGFDIKELKKKWIRSKMGLVSQDQKKKGTSIKENILFGKPKKKMDEVYAAAMTANAKKKIRGLPEEYETKIGERGALLSKKKKQRIAIARAIIKKKKKLLLDEATSALDSEKKKLVQHALDQASMGRKKKKKKNKLSTVKNADQIAVVDGGTIAEIGTHDELINKGGPYSRLVKLQKMVSYIDQENEQFRASSVKKKSTSRHSMSRASPMKKKTAVLKEISSDVSPPAPSFSRLLAMNAPEWKKKIIGSLSALVYGSLKKKNAITIGGMIAAFFKKKNNEMNAIIKRYALIFCSLSMVSIVVNLLQKKKIAYMGEHLVRRIRVQVLEKILTFEAAWFDKKKNSSGSLCSRLSNEKKKIKTLVADRMSLLLKKKTGIIIAATMGLIVKKKIALVMIAVQPSTMKKKNAKKIVLSNVSRDKKKTQHQSTQIAIEAVYNHRMVTSFGCSSKVLKKKKHAQEEPLKRARKKKKIAGLTTGLSPCLSKKKRALDFWYGGKLAQKKKISAGDVFKTFFVLKKKRKLIADAGSMTSDKKKRANAVASVFEVLDRKSISPQNSQVEKEEQKKKIKKKIELKKVDFSYPTRKKKLILQDFSLDVKAGKKKGLVGRSGCGKSTIKKKIQRFYDVDRGAVRKKKMDVREMNILWFRGFTALVSQEPAMFSGSVKKKIAFGKPEADEDEIKKKAKAANAHEFISSLKDEKKNDCGEHGIQLSGGQKKKIAIARAIIRNPAKKKNDEATSALDAQSEQKKKEALDRIMSGRTTKKKKHRLNTIKNVDSIEKKKEGKVVERGSYPQQKKKKGAFYNLAALQK